MNILLLNYFIVLVFVLISVAFYTLMERQVLGLFHLRVGPNRVGVMGVFQPFSDAMKLFLKSSFELRSYNFVFWFFSPILAIILFLLSLMFFPYGLGLYFMVLGLLYFICLLGSSVYFFMFGGYFSGSFYSLLGSYRSVTQMISYEVVLIFLFLGVYYVYGGLDFLVKEEWDFLSFMIYNFPFFVVWLFVILAESNRLPFDFLEGESELVSGFNTEYWGGFFAFIFIYEYGYMIIFSLLTSYIFFPSLLDVFSFPFIIYFYLWIRGTFPRLRYDFLMNMAWKKLLILSLMIFMFFMFF